MMMSKISFILVLGINIAVAQNFWNRFRHQEYPYYHEDNEFYNALQFNPSRIRSYQMVGIPSVMPTLRNDAINDSFEAGVPPIGPESDYGARHSPINILDYLLYRQHVVPRNPFEIYRERALRKQEMVVRHAQTQSVIMAEQYLSNFGSNKDQTCTQRSFCDIATNDDLRSETSIAAAEAIRMMEKMLNFAGKESSRYVTRQKYPHISQLVASYTVGKSTQDRSLCASLFPCNDGIIQDVEARQFSCKQIGKICPGVSLSCGLCAVLSPESCGAVCPVAAIFCGTSGYACSIKSKEEADEQESNEEEDGGAAAAEEAEVGEEAEVAEENEEETDIEDSAEKRSDDQVELKSEAESDSKPQQETVKIESDKESTNENLKSNINLGLEDTQELDSAKHFENIKSPDFKWKSEIHAHKE